MDQRLTPPFFDPLDMRARLTALWRRHEGDSSALRGELIAVLKQLVRDAREAARNALEADGDGRRCAEALSLFQDELIRLIYDFISAHIYRAVNPSHGERLNIVATGGYGRGLLAPSSDIDLLFLLPYKKTPWGESTTEYMLYLLWDLGFKVGHATRTLDQTIRFAKSDVMTRTALLDARLILGGPELWNSFNIGFRDNILSGGQRDFITAKLEERDKAA
jgi:[protein-PII] uridylyltransferase